MEKSPSISIDEQHSGLKSPDVGTTQITLPTKSQQPTPGLPAPTIGSRYIEFPIALPTNVAPCGSRVFALCGSASVQSKHAFKELKLVQIDGQDQWAYMIPIFDEAGKHVEVPAASPPQINVEEAFATLLDDAALIPSRPSLDPTVEPEQRYSAEEFGRPTFLDDQAHPFSLSFPSLTSHPAYSLPWSESWVRFDQSVFNFDPALSLLPVAPSTQTQLGDRRGGPFQFEPFQASLSDDFFKGSEM
ncbi:hypothetical protein BC828DRAFT_392023 [Blastocladiella britannica]|nr:hypothetical protein BC828DRAFT_392023 [Blastocladiella britannica]